MKLNKLLLFFTIFVFSCKSESVASTLDANVCNFAPYPVEAVIMWKQGGASKLKNRAISAGQCTAISLVQLQPDHQVFGYIYAKSSKQIYALESDKGFSESVLKISQ